MTKKKLIPWLEIKTEYLKGCSPKELAEKYDVDIKKLYKKIENAKWAPELSEIKGNIGNEVKEQISCITKLALSRLKDVLSDECVRTSDLVQAIGKALDVSGLKSSKQEITGKDGSALVQNNYIMPKECEDAIQHIKDYIKND